MWLCDFIRKNKGIHRAFSVKTHINHLPSLVDMSILWWQKVLIHICDLDVFVSGSIGGIHVNISYCYHGDSKLVDLPVSPGLSVCWEMEWTDSDLRCWHWYTSWPITTSIQTHIMRLILLRQWNNYSGYSK